MIKSFKGVCPEIDSSVYVSESADIIGKVKIGADSSVWYSAVIRGDDEEIIIGKGTNVQDGVVIHGEKKTVIGDNVTIGHKAIVHGATIHDGSLIGMGAIVLDGAEIGEGCLVGAGALVTSGKKFPKGSLILGSPAKVVRELSEEEIKNLYNSSELYIEVAKEHNDSK